MYKVVKYIWENPAGNFSFKKNVAKQYHFLQLYIRFNCSFLQSYEI